MNYIAPCELDHAEIHQYGDKLAGPVSSAWLRLNGWIACPRLQYRYEPDPANPDIQNHSIFRYGLVFAGTGNNRHLEFYPDFVLCLEGERWMPEGTPLFLFHVSSGIHLVLQTKAYFSLDGASKFRLALQRQNPSDRVFSLRDHDPNTKFVRIGVLRSPRPDRDTAYWPTIWVDGIVVE